MTYTNGTLQRYDEGVFEKEPKGGGGFDSDKFHAELVWAIQHDLDVRKSVADSLINAMSVQYQERCHNLTLRDFIHLNVSVLHRLFVVHDVGIDKLSTRR